MTSKIEFWRVANGFPGTTASQAERAEAEGWDGLSVPDSQNLTGDPYVALALAASVTSKLLLRPGVTNSFTRHPKDAHVTMRGRSRQGLETPVNQATEPPAVSVQT
jgi:hypothetical protein